MTRTPYRLIVAAWTLVAMGVAVAAPVVTSATAALTGKGEDHSCCPQAVTENSSANRPAAEPLPCCAIRSGNPQTPSNVPTAARASDALVAMHAGPSWSQSLTPTRHITPAAMAVQGPIPLLIRTSVLLI